MIRKMWELIKVIEELGIEIRSAKWEENDRLNIDVDSRYHEEASAAIQEFWRKEREERFANMELIEFPWEDGGKT